MKKWITLILAAVMAFGLVATAMADGFTLDEKTTSQKVEFSIVIPATFTWSIPNFEPTVGDEMISTWGNLKFWDFYLPFDSGDIAVTITSKNGNCFKDALGNALPYTLTAPNQVSGKDSYYLAFGDDAKMLYGLYGSPVLFRVQLEASTKGNYIAGTFSDELTFSPQIIDRTAENLTLTTGGWAYAG